MAARIENWAQMAGLARRHQVHGFLQDRLANCDAVPLPFRKKWKSIAIGNASTNLRQANATGELHEHLNQAGIANLVLKGLPLAAQVYDSLTIKRSGDIDLLVDPADGFRAIEELQRQGFVTVETRKPLNEAQARAVMRHYKEITLVRDNNSQSKKLVVDLHWRLVEHEGLLRDLDPFEEARHISIENVGDIAVLSEKNEFAYLCVHGALSDWSRMKWLSDVVAVIGERSDQAVIELYEHCATVGAQRCMLQALGLRELLFAKPVPEPLAEKLDAIEEPEFLTYPMQRMLEPYRPASSRDTFSRIRMQARIRKALHEGSSGEGNDLSSHLHALPDILAVPLPASLDWLYVPLRPVLWLARRFA